ncbi:hypothetical protein OC65_19860 [Salmonella enterica]|nr:hypothetical protein [Salmonella enterica]
MCKFRYLALIPPLNHPRHALPLRSRTYGGDPILSKQYIAAYPEELPMNNQPLRVSKDQPRKPDKTPEDEGKNPKKNQK